MKPKNKLLYIFLGTTLLLFSSCVGTQNVEKPKQAISYEKAKVLQEEYNRTRANFLNEYLRSKGVLKKENEEDVRDVWFDLKVLKQYIAYVEAEAKKQGHKNLGLRVVLGAYPNNLKYPDPGFATVFFMPTYKKDYNPKKASLLSILNFQETGDEYLEDVDGLNFGMGGKPPKDL